MEALPLMPVTVGATAVIRPSRHQSTYFASRSSGQVMSMTMASS